MSHAPDRRDHGRNDVPRSYRRGFSSLRAGTKQVLGITKVASRLGPKQVKDELQIATLEMKDKGIKLGIGAGLIVTGLIFLLLAVVALVIAAVAGLAKLMPAWLAALLIAALFLVILAVLVLAGLSRIKKQLPLKPESAIFGLLYDIGVVKEGSGYTATRVRREQRERRAAAEEEAAEKKRRQAAGEVPQEPVPTQEQLTQRTKARRDHLKQLRDDLNANIDSVRRQTRGMVSKTKTDVQDAPHRAKGMASSLVANAQDPEALQARWKPLAVLIASTGAFFLFLGRLLKRR